MRAAACEYFATSSMAIVRPRIPAPAPPSSSGMHRPVRPASTKRSKRSWGYSLGRVDLARTRRDTLLGELADGRLELRELGRQIELHRSRLPAVPLDRPFADGGQPAPRARQAVRRRWRTSRRRSRAVIPPHTPSFSRAEMANSRQASRTGHCSQIAFAASAATSSSSDGVEDLGIHAATSRLVTPRAAHRSHSSLTPRGTGRAHLQPSWHARYSDGAPARRTPIPEQEAPRPSLHPAHVVDRQTPDPEGLTLRIVASRGPAARESTPRIGPSDRGRRRLSPGNGVGRPPGSQGAGRSAAQSPSPSPASS